MTLILPDELSIKEIHGSTATVERGVKELHDSEGFTYGGYGKATYETPLWQVLTRYERRELASVRKLHEIGAFDLLRKKYGGEKELDKITTKILEKAMKTPRELTLGRSGQRSLRTNTRRNVGIREDDKG